MTITTTLITGGSGGIGLEMARQLAARGHRLVLTSRDARRLQEVAEDLHRAHGVDVEIRAIDLSSPGAAQHLFDATEGAGLRIDALINNAGFGVVDEHVTIDAGQLHRMLHARRRRGRRAVSPFRRRDEAAALGSHPQRRIAGGHHFGKASRADPRAVASAGVDLLLGGGLSRVVGLTNRVMVLGNRFVPRAVVAAVSKRLLRPLDVRASAT